jgi:hypothetical protein
MRGPSGWRLKQRADCASRVCCGKWVHNGHLRLCRILLLSTLDLARSVLTLQSWRNGIESSLVWSLSGAAGSYSRLAVEVAVPRCQRQCHEGEALPVLLHPRCQSARQRS